MQFLYNENREVVAEKDYSGNIIRYIRGLGLISSDSENAKTYYHYVCDEQGSVSRIIRGEDKENGAAAQDKVSDRVLNHYEYDAFGNTISCEERVANRFRYQSGRISNLDDGLNFSNRALEHMGESGRQVPIQTLQDAIRYGEAMPDPRGSNTTMYYTTMYKNGKMYNLEVLYDEISNTVYHFEYARKAMGNLPAIPK